MNSTKPLGELELRDFEKTPVWRPVQTPDGELDEETVYPVESKKSIADGDVLFWVRASGKLADGTPVAAIAHAQSPPPELSNWSFYIEGKWLSLLFAPAPDFVLKTQGPGVFVKALNRDISEVFPMRVTSDVIFDAIGTQLTVTILSTGPIRA